ncbi:MAG: cobalt-precorrin 5A hydrolase [Desulfobacterales bacterium]|nr:cobalt-precorrin 5A hydrolase [Desulfobacterales bacterium]
MNSEKVWPDKIGRIAVWCITPGGVNIISRLADKWSNADIYISSKVQESLPLQEQKNGKYFCFNKLGNKVAEVFTLYKGHIFVMSTGIVVRMTAPLIKDKTSDPAVVVVDDKGKYAISLISGHLGGANDLAEKTAEIIGAQPIITTATDINNLPSVDVIAKKSGLEIENPHVIKTVSMAFLKEQQVNLFDPYMILKNELPKSYIFQNSGMSPGNSELGIYISDETADIPENYLILRPKNLVAGIGCNKGTDVDEMQTFLMQVMKKFGLSPMSLRNLASIDIKHDEKGLTELSENLELPVEFYSRHDLNLVKNIETPSDMVEKHVGVKSVCEAAAMLSAQADKLVVVKQKTGNVTVAIARTAMY